MGYRCLRTACSMMGNGRLIEVNTLLESDPKGEHNRMLAITKSTTEYSTGVSTTECSKHNQMLSGQLSTTKCPEQRQKSTDECSG
jgi:hypothetical protein